MRLTIDEINQIDNSDVIGLVDKRHKDNINAPAGIHHYKLLTYLSMISTGYIVELGTHYGTGAIAISKNKDIHLHTFDLTDKWSASIFPSNVTRHIGDIFTLQKQKIMLDANWIFVDIDHRGVRELEIHNYLNENGYRGFAIYDDIHYNKEMIDFWASVENEKKDITDIGHGYSPNSISSGTGIIYY